MWNKYLLWLVKIVFSVFNIPATWHVFSNIFSSVRSGWLVHFSTICAILLIDLVFLWLLDILENEQLDPKDRAPAALSAMVMAVSILWIGFIDEGFLAVAPRISIIMIVVYDILVWSRQRTMLYNSRGALLEAMQDSYDVKRHRQALKARFEALEANYANMVEHFSRIERDSLLAERSVGNGHVTHSEEVVDDLPAGIYKTEQGYAWVSPVDNSSFETTAQGKPYTLQGAKQALKRHVNGNSLSN